MFDKLVKVSDKQLEMGMKMNQKFMENNPDLVQKQMEASLKMHQQLQQNNPELYNNMMQTSMQMMQQMMGPQNPQTANTNNLLQQMLAQSAQAVNNADLQQSQSVTKTNANTSSLSQFAAPMAPSYNEAIKDDGNGPISKRKRACCTIL